MARIPSLAGSLALLATLSIALASGCKKDQPPKEEPKAEAPTEEKEKKEKAEPAGPGKPHSSGIPGTQNQLEWDDDVPNVTFSLTAPQDDEVLKSGEKVSVKFDLENYRTGEEIGQHVHVILDNNPYIAHYNAEEPLVLEGVKPGTHTIRAFPSRHYHMSLKKGDVFDTVIFHVEKKSDDFTFDPEKPFITYSRPKGTYSGEAAKNLLMDFHATNVDWTKHKVVYSVDGEKKGELTEWKPLLLPALGAGEHEINLKLVGADGNVVKNGGYNDTTRTITVK